MCVKSCLCNTCYKISTCSDCEHICEHEADECYVKGITVCKHHITLIEKRRQRHKRGTGIPAYIKNKV